ncbi:DNA-directed DNA polymerase II small subunit [Archaeoglobus sp.]
MVIKNIDVATVAKKFLVRGYNINPKAAELICNFGEISDEIISEVCRVANGKFIVGEEDVKAAINKIKTKKNGTKARVQKVKSELGEKKDGGFRVIKDVTGTSVCEGKVEDFVCYFNSRLEKLSRILRSRIHPVSIAHIGKRKMESVSVVGMVTNVWERGDRYIIQLEDSTGSINCVASGKTAEIASELLGDEVIGVTGSLRGKTLIADRIVFPDVPINGNGEKVKKDFSIIFLSDTHFGSKEFLEKEWELFVKWLNGEVGGEKGQKLAESVKYIVIAGDIVDGIGVYPGQEKDLAIMDIYGQYESAAAHIDELPKRIRIIISPGNHDAVRQAEPQPSLPSEIRNLFPNNVYHVGNPAYIDLEGVKLLIYHGRSIDDLVAKIPRLSYEEPQKVMEELLRRRHLSPMYGGRSPVAPEKEDYLVIDEVPDILHCGHIHTYGTGFYRGVFMVNSSTWQAQTEFQKKVNLNPMPGNVAVYRPGGEVVRLRFYGE